MTTTAKFMKTLSAAVGIDQLNRKHDVALIQAALKLIKDHQSKPYYPGPITGMFDAATAAAIGRFQLQGMASLPNSPANLAKVLPTSPTAQALLQKLPDGTRLATIPNHHVVYRAAKAEQLARASGTLDKELNLSPDFRKLLHKLNQMMFLHHSLVFAIAGPGGFRDFEAQFKLCTTPAEPPETGFKSDAGPGESNHNYGNGCDFGFFEFAFLRDNGKWREGNFANQWLLKLPADLRPPFWSLRNSYFPHGQLFPTKKKGDDVHVQAYNDDDISMPKSLADLMSRESPNCYWARANGQYCSNLIFADDDKKWDVGNAKKIWSLQATVSSTEVAEVLEKARNTRNLIGEYDEPLEQAYLAFAGPNRPRAKKWTATEISATHIKKMREYLKEDFVAAGKAYKSWIPLK